jgi:hypothetical protein
MTTDPTPRRVNRKQITSLLQYLDHRGEDVEEAILSQPIPRSFLREAAQVIRQFQREKQELEKKLEDGKYARDVLDSVHAMGDALEEQQRASGGGAVFMGVDPS